MAYLDLDELPQLFDASLLWSARRPAPAWFRRADYLGDPHTPLREAVAAVVAETAGLAIEGPVRVLTHLRYLGHCFNPVSFYYCFEAGHGGQLHSVLAEVTNTPWGERHCYVLPQDRPAADELRARSMKAMHVSPFHPMGLRYDWLLRTPGDALAAHMTLRSTELAAAPLFGATLMLRRVPITGMSLAGTLLRFPWMTAKVVAAIIGRL